MTTARHIGLGCMRLSTEPDRDDARSIEILRAALEAGVTLLDTADAYCWNDTERGHNERLIARALSASGRDRSTVTVATKGGMTRPEGRWEPDGRARHIAAACEASCRALDAPCLDLYQLHVPDPRTPLSTSVRALAALQRRGLIKAIGLCNVTVGQIEEARRIADIQSIQVELSVWHDEHFLSGVAEYCATHRLLLLAHRPLGGRRSLTRTKGDPALMAIAARHNATPFEIALAWLSDLSEAIVPIPGVTRIETAQSAVRARSIVLTDEDRAALDERCQAARGLQRRRDAHVRTSSRPDAEVVLVMGLPGAGKSTYAEALSARGYLRLNRDAAGGSLRDLILALDRALTDGVSRVVLDNTYVSRQSRAQVIHAAADHGVAVRCVWLSTTVEDAQVNAVERLVSRYGHLPGEAELASLKKADVAAFLPTVQFRYQRELEPPEPVEGFSQVEVVPFARQHRPGFVNRAVIVWCDDVLLKSRSGHRVPLDPDDVAVDTDYGTVLKRYRDEGWRILGLSWQPEIAGGSRSASTADAVFTRMSGLLEVAVEVEYCPHAAGPPRCWCRKPLPGLGVVLIHRHRLDAAACVYVGAGPQDPGYARRLGFTYWQAGRFFSRPEPD